MKPWYEAREASHQYLFHAEASNANLVDVEIISSTHAAEVEFGNGK